MVNKLVAVSSIVLSISALDVMKHCLRGVILQTLPTLVFLKFFLVKLSIIKVK